MVPASTLVSRTDIDTKKALGVVDGLFKIHPIFGDYIDHALKEFDHVELESCVVFREEPVNQIRALLVQCIGAWSQPGIYLQGPSGVGKSVLTYTITQLAKFHLGWLTIYIPRCEDWMKRESTVAMGFFLERVLEAFSVEHLQKKHPDIFRKLDINRLKWWQRLLPTSFSRPKETDILTWELLALKNPELVRTTYAEVKRFLWSQREESGGTPVLLVFDEVNALWAGEERPRITEPPWDLTSFTKSGPRWGALLVTGTTDAEFFRTMPAPFRQANVYKVGPLTDAEVVCLQNTNLGQPLKWIHNFDESLWNSIKDSSGNLPRELALFARKLNKIIAGWKETVDDDEDGHEPPIKKRKLLSDRVELIRAENYQRYQTEIYRVQSIDKNHIFTRALFNWCQSYFLKNSPHSSDQVLRVPNFVVASDNMMRPSTVDAARALFEWFRLESDESISKIGDFSRSNLANMVSHLAVLAGPNTGGARGNAFEAYLSAKLTVLSMHEGHVNFHRRSLSSVDVVLAQPLTIKERIFAVVDQPPSDCMNFPQGTLLTHAGEGGGDAANGGEARVDIIYYTRECVTYIEATVGHYPSTKIPTKADSQGRLENIVSSVQKWIGASVYDVTAHTTTGLTATYKQTYSSRANSERPDPPILQYVIATTCPKTILPEKTRMKKYGWIQVCFLEDLVSSKIIPAEVKEGILQNQAENAGRME